MHVLSKDKFKEDYLRELKVRSAKKVDETSTWDRYNALGSLIRHYIAEDWVDTMVRYRDKKSETNLLFLNGIFNRSILSK